MWFLEQKAYNQMQMAEKNGIIPSAEQLADFQAEIAAASDGTPRIMAVVGNRAGINITGVLTDAPSWIARWFGGGNTTYSEIRTALAMADADPNVSEIVLNFNSPGGQAGAEMLDTMKAVRGTEKPTTAFVGAMAASAAFGLAAQADTIEAQNELSAVGSVGVVTTRVVNESVVTITSSNAPNKRPDPQTDAGIAAIREELDAVEDVFIGEIATGRDTTVSKVRKNYGRGAIVFAGDAINFGMIDKISTSGQAVAGEGGDVAAEEKETTAESGNTEVNIMDLAALQKDHPEVYAQAVKAGVDQERDRVNALVIMGTAAGAMDIALKAVKDGTDTDNQTLKAEFFSAQINKNNLDAAADDDKEISAAADGAEQVDHNATESMEDKVMGQVAANLGVDYE